MSKKPELTNGELGTLLSQYYGGSYIIFEKENIRQMSNKIARHFQDMFSRYAIE